jgi:hypothetical protein
MAIPFGLIFFGLSFWFSSGGILSRVVGVLVAAMIYGVGMTIFMRRHDSSEPKL